MDGRNGARKLVIPGVGEVAVQEVQVAQAIAQVAGLLDLQLQVTLRLARGWDIEDIITDMKLNVAAVPGNEGRSEG